jgi:hypothetical protein
LKKRGASERERAKPSDLPVCLDTNLKIAKPLGLHIPPSLLARADEVIE